MKLTVELAFEDWISEESQLENVNMLNLLQLLPTDVVVC